MRRYSTALITGASSGIGACFAEALAAAGTDLILVARSTETLEALAARLRAQHACSVTVIATDLSVPGAGARLAAAVDARSLAVDLLINNAGFGGAGAFAEAALPRQQAMLNLNCAAVLELTHALLPAMLKAGHGAVINVASVAGFHATPYMTLYGATKAFVISFSEGLWAECRARGVRVQALCPGPVDTGFFTAAGDPQLRQSIPAAMMMQPGDVVRMSLKALPTDRVTVVPGLPARLTALLARWLPRRWIVLGTARAMLRALPKR